ncbi:MAG: p-aminobenzoyl-glutamate transport protein [Verrucomicrobiota bacterium]
MSEHRVPSPTHGSPFQRFLNGLERAGNALPHPATLFVILAAGVVLLSGLLAGIGLAVPHPVTGSEVRVVSLLSHEGFQRILSGVLPNFINFAPLGTVLLCMIGLALVETSGLMGAVLRLMAVSAHPRILSAVVVFAGVMSHSGGDIGYVLLIPLGGALFHAVGRNPIVGLAAAFAGVSGGFSANLLLGTTDVLLSGLTQEAARILDKAYVVTPVANYYFMAVSALVITALGTWVTERIVEPRIGRYTGDAPAQPLTALTPLEKRGLLAALVALLVLVGVVVAGVLPTGGFLLDPKRPDFMSSLFLRQLPVFIFLFGLLPGLAYGIAAGTVRNDADVINGMSRTMQSLASYIVLAFFIAQFVAFFNWTNLGMITAVEGAAFLRWLDLGPIPLMIAFVLLAAVIDLVLGSASAKWAVMAPIFVPMFMLLGYSPEMAQAAYRIGDSVVNIVTPLMSYFPLILTFVQRYDSKAGLGTLVATMLPYSLAFLLGWTLLLVVWIWAGWPLGPGAPLFLPTRA